MKVFVIALLGLAGVLAALEVFAGPFFSLSVREWPPAAHGARVVGGVEGPVKRTDEAAHVVRIASGFLGLSSLPVLVTPETTIAVNGKLGWWGDLHRGLIVRVSYEVGDDARLIASRVEVLHQADQPSASIPSVDDREEAPRPATAAPPGDEAPRAVSRPAEPTVDAPLATRVAPKASAPAREPGKLRPAPARARVRTTAPPAAATPLAGTAASSTEDGGAAVDWLLKGPVADR